MLTAPQSILVSTEALFGAGEDLIPEGSIITQATLEVANEADESEIRLIRLLEPESLGDDFTSEQGWRQSPPAGHIGFNVHPTLQAWSDGEPNHGWALLQSSDTTSEAGHTNAQLTVHFIPPQDVAQVAWFLATLCRLPHSRPGCSTGIGRAGSRVCRFRCAGCGRAGSCTVSRRTMGGGRFSLKTAEGLPDVPAGARLIHAMSHWQLGNQQEARQLPTARSPRPTPKTSEEEELSLPPLLAEAAALIGATFE